MSLETELSPKYRDMFLDPIFQHDFKVLSKRLIKKDPEYREEIKDIIKEVEESFDSSLVTSELRPIQRIAIIESTLGVNETIDYEDDERELSVLEKIASLEDKFDNLDLNAVENPCIKEDTEVIPTTKTEHRACGLFEELKKVKDRAGHKFLSSDEMNHFLRYGVEEEYRVKEGQNIRQIKKEVLVKMKKMFSADVFLSQKTTGWKNYRLVLKA
jgi:hypothetical protein